MTVVKREIPMTLPSITFCNYEKTSVHDILLGCDFGIVGDTCIQDNVTVYDGPYKMFCIRFNFGSNATILQKSELEGPDLGYKIMLYIPNRAQVWLGLLDNNDLAVDSDIKKKIIPGDYNEITLSKSIQKSLPDPFSNCEETPSLSGSVVSHRQVNCAEICYNRVMTEICKCEFPEGCPTPWEWIGDCKYAYSFHNYTLIKADCLNKCPLECNQVEFPVTRLNYKLESSWVDNYKDDISKKFDIRNQTKEQITSRMAYVQIYYDSLDTTEITQFAKMTMLDLISNIGGILGILKTFIQSF